MTPYDASANLDEHGAPDAAGAIRTYTTADYAACRALWVELTEHHRAIYEDASIGGDDPGGGFDAYLALPERAHTWVAVADVGVVGLTGLLARERSGEIEPVVVAASHRGRGVGRLLIERAVAAARVLGFEYVTVRPVARNVDAIRTFHEVGFKTLGGHVDLSMDLVERPHTWRDGASLHGREFGY